MGAISNLQAQIDQLTERVEKLERDDTPKQTVKRTSASTGSSTTAKNLDDATS